MLVRFHLLCNETLVHSNEIMRTLRRVDKHSECTSCIYIHASPQVHIIQCTVRIHYGFRPVLFFLHNMLHLNFP